MPENASPRSLNDQNQENKKPRFNLYTWLFDNPERFFWVIVLLGLIGGLAALMVPNCIDWQISSNNSADTKVEEIRQKSISDLRLHVLYITGGIIAILTLLQNSWKNQIDRQKIEDDIQKNKNDHIRQVHAERRSRYTKAVEQLANEKAAVRLGGIYTLVGLVDEWLADDTLESEEQQKEGQVIINNLCSYIRSPFPLAAKIEEYEARKELEKLQKTESEKLREAESSLLQVLLKRFENSGEYEEPKDITADYAKFHEEQDVRRTIFVEMSKRSSAFTKNDKGEIIETVPGIWSDFNFDFSRAPIFYPLNRLTIEKGNFSSAKFYSNSDFSWAKFAQTARFSEATFTQTANFSWATFTQTANFRRATFTQTADFGGAKFDQTADFYGATFTQTADFGVAKFDQTVKFGGAKFAQTANFGRAKFAQTADFYGAKFAQTARFRGATFTQTARFSGAKFAQTADFSKATFTQTANFSWATFTQTVNFSEATFSASSPKFVETYEVLGMTFRARFATLPKNQRADSFTVSEGSFPILLGEAELGDGIKHDIPVGTVLFDPDSWDEEKQEYTRVSKPAKPLDDSDSGEENTTE
ncbi:pentapeptide repeat-containing protein [Rothia mucilaginosa]|uniref:pentapeptide repeat-containing protein n=1 Tax=Rothia mucilaginosa TaxID=43675 RepID=UPI0026EB99E4|nr:pentapeptide repeat-containing protein [Rothia mucilaginosa]